MNTLICFGYMCVFSRSVMSNSLRPHRLACQAPLSMEFSRQEYWSGLPFPSPGVLPYPGIKPVSLAFPELAGRFLLPLSHLKLDLECIADSYFSLLKHMPKEDRE